MKKNIWLAYKIQFLKLVIKLVAVLALPHHHISDADEMFLPLTLQIN